jgi:hypothetical protein
MCGNADLICESLFEDGILEISAANSIDGVRAHVLNEVNSEFLAVAKQKGHKVETLSCLSGRDFTDVLHLALPTIERTVVSPGAEMLDNIAAAFAQLKVNGEIVKRIETGFFEAVFKGIGEVISSHPLIGASIIDFRDVLCQVMSFGRSVKTVTIDQRFLEQKVMALREILIDRFHEDYVSRLERALGNKSWNRVEPEQRHFDMLRKLTRSNMKSLTLDGDTYSGSRPLLILLELTFQYVEVARRIDLLADDFVRKLFASVRVFAVGSSHALHQAGGIVELPILALSASGLDFYARLVPSIAVSLSTTKAQRKLVKGWVVQTTEELNASYKVVMKRIEDVLVKAVNNCLVQQAGFGDCDIMKAVDTELDSWDMAWTETVEEVLARHQATMDCLPKLLVEALFDRVRLVLSTEYRKLAQGRKSTLV